MCVCMCVRVTCGDRENVCKKVLRPNLIPKPHSKTSFQSLIPRPHSKASFQGLIPRPHSKTSFQGLIPRPHSKASFQGLPRLLHKCERAAKNRKGCFLPFFHFHIILRMQTKGKKWERPWNKANSDPSCHFQLYTNNNLPKYTTVPSLTGSRDRLQP